MWTYILIGVVVVFVLLLCLALAVASFSFANFREKHDEFSKVESSCGFRASDFVRETNKEVFDGKIKQEICEEFKDHYTAGKIALSFSNHYSKSLTSFATAAHEMGHAKQDFSSKKLRTLWRLKRTSKILGFFFTPLLVGGFVLSLVSLLNIIEDDLYLYVGIAVCGIALGILIFSIFLKTREISIEKEASEFGLGFLKKFLTDVELQNCKEFLDSARLTYWAMFLRGLLGWTMLTNKESLFK